MPLPRPSVASVRVPLLVFLTSGIGALVCIPAMLLGPGDNALLLQFMLVGVTFCGAAVYRHRTSVYGDRPGERAPIVLGHPRKPGVDRTARFRVTAAWAMALSALYYLGIIVLIVSPAARKLL